MEQNGGLANSAPLRETCLMNCPSAIYFMSFFCRLGPQGAFTNSRENERHTDIAVNGRLSV